MKPSHISSDRLASLAATLLDAPLAFITVDDMRSFSKSCIGVDAEAPEDRHNLVDESFCQYVIGSREPLIVDDAANDARTRDNPSVARMGVAAWAAFCSSRRPGRCSAPFAWSTQPVHEPLHLTAILARLRAGFDGVTGRLCAAGHVPALVRRASGRVEDVAPPGTLLGAVTNVELTDVDLRLGRGDQLVLYTDGVVEARRGGELFGEARLASLLETTAGDADAVAEAVAAAARDWTETDLRDDVAVLVVGVPA